jgi:hypothetical protein
MWLVGSSFRGLAWWRQKLIDDDRLYTGALSEAEREALGEFVCFEDTKPLERLVALAVRDGFVRREELGDLDDPDFDADELQATIITAITMQDGDPQALFAAWRVGSLKY